MKHAIFQLKNFFLRPKSIQFYRQIVKESQLDEESRNRLIFERMQSLVKDAFDNTVFYRDLYANAGLEDGIILSMSEFSQLPPLNKDNLRSFFEGIINRKSSPKNRKQSTTGGSTGKPVKVYHDKTYSIDAIGWFVLKEFGGDISDNAAFLERYNPHTSQFCLNKIMWYPTKRCFLDITLLTEESLFKFYQQCLKISPVYLQGYVGAIQEFADYLKRNSLTLPSLRFVWTTAAPLPESNRTYMENIFHVPVYNQYGCCEVFWLAYECQKKNGLHYFDTIRHFEVCDENMRQVPDGEEGELLLTDLLNHVFPLIRYRNGDRVCKLSRKCTCGNNFPLISSVKGRTTDIIRFPDGSSVPGDYMTTLFDDAPDSVGGFQVIQHKDYSLTLRYVPVNDASSDQVEKVCEKLRKRFSQYPISVKGEATTEISHDRGKTRFIVSEIS